MAICDGISHFVLLIHAVISNKPTFEQTAYTDVASDAMGSSDYSTVCIILYIIFK